MRRKKLNTDNDLKLTNFSVFSVKHYLLNVFSLRQHYIWAYFKIVFCFVWFFFRFGIPILHLYETKLYQNPKET